jgi:hypothetical protein
MSSTIPYDLYLIIQSILNKQSFRFQFSPNLLTPLGWSQTYTSFFTQSKGLITSPLNLPVSGSYTFQLSYTVQPPPGTIFNALALEVRLYYCTDGSVIDPTKSPFYGIATLQLDDQNHDGVFVQTNTIVVPNVIAPLSGQTIAGLFPTIFQLGYWVGSLGGVGNNANISFTIQDCFFTRYSGLQTLSPTPVRLLPNEVSRPKPPPPGQIPRPVTRQLVPDLSTEGFVYCFQTLEWDPHWNDQTNRLIYLGIGNITGNPEDVYTITDTNGKVLPVVYQGNNGGEPVYFYNPPFQSTTWSWSFQLTAPLLGTLPAITPFAYY